MLKVLLVDDEVQVRDELKKSIDWMACGCEVAAELSDGERAYTYISTEHPDIVITDLQMPYMDGLTLSRLIKEEYEDTEIIMITSCTDFSCVQYAMHIGVSDYILKSAGIDELKAAVNKCANRIMRRKSVEESLERYVRDKELDNQRERNDFFDELVFRGKSPADIIRMAKEYEIDLAAMCYSVILVNVIAVGPNYEDSAGTLEAVDYELRELADNSGVIIFDREIYGKGLILKADSEKNMVGHRSTFIEQVKDILYKYDYIKFYGGAGTTVNRLSDMYISYEKAFRAYAQSYVLRENLIIDSDEMEEGVYVEDDDFHISDLDMSGIDKNAVHKYLRFGDEGRVVEFVDGLFGNVGDDALNSSTFRRYYIVDIYLSVCEFLEGIGYNRLEVESPDITYEILQNRENSRRYVINILEKALSFREKSSKGRYGDIVNEVKRYIDDNYADDKLSLNVLATHVNFSPNHLSMIFSQQTGITFIKYLTDYRMNKAKELLRYTGMRSSEISLEVGYKDPHYFSYLFKKTQGMTPTQYRNSE